MSKKFSASSLKLAFSEIIWPRRRLILYGLLLIAINRASGLVLPGSTKYLLDDVIANSNFDLLWILLAVVTGALLIQSATSYFLTQLLSVEAQKLISEMRIRVHNHILRLPVGFFDENKSGALVSRIMTDVEGIRNLVGTGLVILTGGILTSLAALALLIHINALMTVYILVPVLIFGLVAMKAFTTIRPIFRQRGEINAEVTGRLTETLNGIRVIKGFNAEQSEVTVFEKGAGRLFENVRKTLTATSLTTMAATLLLGLASVGIMGIGGYHIMTGTMTVGDFIAFTLYLGFMIAPIVQMTSIGTQMTEAFAGLDRTREILSVRREDDDDNRTEVLPVMTGHLEFRNVSFEYAPGQPVLTSVSFDAPPGSVTALVGTSGSGKTTIAGLAASFLQPGSGEILMDGVSLQKLRLDAYRQHLGVVLQDDFLFEGTIRENILFPRPDATEERLLHAVEAAYVSEFTSRFEKGLDTVIGERGVKLSGGQRQRVAIARAILADPKLLILDEATSSLDNSSEAFIQKSLQELMRGRTTLVIAHRLSTIRSASQILVIEKGEIAERGTHEDLIKAGGRYFDLYTYQARI